MTNSVRIRYKSYLAASGFDSNGTPKQGKQEVVGKIVVTSYNSGESLPPSKIGLSTIDYISITHDEGAGSASGQARMATYSYTAQEFYVFEQSGAAGMLDTPVVGENFTLSFLARGDSALDVELL